MKRLKKIIKYIGLLILLLFFARRFIYQSLMNYVMIDVRQNVTLIDKKLLNEIDKKTPNKTMNIEDIINLSNEITSQKLSFTFNKVSNNPNKIYKTGKANCKGYSSLFNSIGNYLVSKQKLADKYEFRHLYGKIDILGMNIHKFSTSPFFKFHDYNVIINKQTREKIYIDPSLNDYLGIDYVRSK